MSVTSTPTSPLRGSDRRTSLLVGLVAAIAVTCWLFALPHLAPWGDGLRILADYSGGQAWQPHIGYSWCVNAIGAAGAEFGWSIERSLELLSLFSCALGFGVVAATATFASGRSLAALGWTLVAAAAPSVTLLCSIVEVHGVQLLGSACGLALLVLSRNASRPRRAVATLLAMLVAVCGHTTHVLLVVPFAIHFAAAHARRRAVVLTLLGAAVASGLIAYVAVASFREHGAPQSSVLKPLGSLGRYVELTLEHRSTYGWFSPTEMAEFAWNEALSTGAFLWVALAGLRSTRRERSDAGFMVALAIYFVVLAQFGIRERGAYFITLFPWLVLVGARLHVALPWCLLVFQVALGWSAASNDAQREDARAWGADLAGVVEVPLTLFTSEMVRHTAVPAIDNISMPVMWYLFFQYTPERGWDTARAMLDGNLAAAVEHGHLYFDADVLPDASGRGAAWQHWTARFFDEQGFTVRHIARPGAESSGGEPRRYLVELTR